MRTSTTTLTGLFVCVTLLVSTGKLMGDETPGLLGVGGDPPTSFGTENHLELPIMVGTEADPIHIWPTPPGGPDWLKDFFVPIAGIGIAAGMEVEVQEHIRMETPLDVPPIGVTDWHQSIVGGPDADNFIWGGGTISVDGDESSGIVSSDGKTIDFFFDEVFPDFTGIDLIINKTLVWTGPTITGSGDPEPRHVQVQQNPTPEPGVVGLLGLSAVMLLRRQRRS